MRFGRFASLTALTILAAAPASALTAGEVLERMSSRQQNGYITGIVDALLHLEQVPTRGPTPRSGCILRWYYGKEAPGPRQVIFFFDANRDKSAPGLIKILIDRACGTK